MHRIQNEKKRKKRKQLRTPVASGSLANELLAGRLKESADVRVDEVQVAVGEQRRIVAEDVVLQQRKSGGEVSEPMPLAVSERTEQTKW